jgi:hypothetical protein
VRRAQARAQIKSEAEPFEVNRVTALERAFQIAKSGKCSSLTDLKKRLRAEGYSIAQITGRTLAKQLEVLIKTARRHTLKA